MEITYFPIYRDQGNNFNSFQFVHECIDDLIGKKRASFDSYSGDIEWSKREHDSARKTIQNLLIRCALEDADVQSFTKDLSTDLQQTIKECYGIRKDEILQAVMRENLIENDVPFVENVDWKLKWILGSSKFASLNEPLLQVDLHCLPSRNESTKCVNFEMNLTQTEKLISDLKKARQELTASSPK